MPPLPELLLALAKITALLLVIFAVAPFLKNPAHRARLWTLTFLILPFVMLSSFTTALLKLIPHPGTTEQNPSQTNTASNVSVIHDGFGNKLRYYPHPDDPAVGDWNFSNYDSSAVGQGPWILDNAAHPTPLDFSPLRLPVATSGQPKIVRKIIPPKKLPKPEPPLFYSWLPFILVSGTSVVLVPFFISCFKILCLSKSSPLNPPRSIWQRIHQSVRKTPSLFFTPSPAAPFTCGFISPCVLLPNDSPTWPLRRIKSTLFHEAAHLHRCDPLIRFLATLVRAAMWFHPLVWLAHRQLIIAQEQACDQHALANGIAPDDYAEDLLAAAAHSHLTPSEALAMAKFSQLGNRVRHVLNQPKPTSMKTIGFTSSLALCATFTLTAIGFSDEQPSTGKKRITLENSAKIRGTILDRNNKPLAIDDEKGMRTYPTGKSTAHLIGYVRQPTQEEPDRPKGISGIEKSGNASLSDKQDVQLTIDSNLQQKCYQLLAAQEHPGAIVVQDPTTGEILALTSYPSFDPQIFVPAISKENFGILNGDKTHPFKNRATSTAIPGSIIKPLVALAGEYVGLNNPEIHCLGVMEFEKTKVHDWISTRDEKFRLPGALAQSCNTYFMELGIRTGRQAMTEIESLFHLNEPPLSSIPSSKSLWMATHEPAEITQATLAVSSLGQGHTSMTPLHISTITSAIASGTWHQPHLVNGREKTKPSFSLVGQGRITIDSLKAIRSGLHLAVHGKRGTATHAAIPGIQLAGKTGTALVRRNSERSHNSWFTGYGPYQSPKYSVTVMLNGPPSGGRFAAPIAAEVFKALLKSQ